jgi:phosphoglucosamine mutase
MTVYPQVLVNVRDVDHHGLASDEQIAAAVSDAEHRLGTAGRVLLRPSGTEPLVRVMVEAEDAAIAEEVSEALAAIVRERLSH